jgi:FAD/FMN-containing dehydrogenase
MRVRNKHILLLLGVVCLGVVAVSCQPTYLVFNAWLHDLHDRAPTPAGFVDDASHLNETRVVEVLAVAEEPAAAEHQLRGLLARARAEKLGVSIAGARHSMGGHVICPDGLVLNMLPLSRMDLDTAKKRLRVGAGARWSGVVPFLDARGFSVAVMQSNNDFSVGGSLSVNCHGWQTHRPPIASTVESLRVMKADGSVVTCSRHENSELFSLVLGGYGLFGIILEAELGVVPNERYRPEAEVVRASQYAARFAATVDENTPMAYGRLCVVPGEPFLKEGILTRFRKAPCKDEEIPALGTVGYTALRREVFRAQIGKDAGKALRWKLETRIGEIAHSKFFARNQLFNEPAEIYQEQNANRTDILHEYFIPLPRMEEFLAQVRIIVPRHTVDLLNVTVRHLREDKDTFLRYADQEMLAFVMLFNQPRQAGADAIMETITREMIDAALACGGRYYLPYRLHGTTDQFHRAYPQAAEFFAKKRHYDPDGIFRNQFYRKYAGE